MFKTREKKADTSAIEADLERKAVEAEAEALAKADELFASYEAEHERQVAGYVFECRRWGDFLTLHIDRRGNGEPVWSDAPSKLSTTLNIGACSGIRLIEGHAPDRDGELTYRFRVMRDGPEYWSSSDCYLQEGASYTVAPDYPYLPDWRSLWHKDEKKEREHSIMMGYRESGYSIKHTTTGYPRPAEDAQITFDGIGVTVYVPATLGEEIYGMMLAEIERGWERPEPPNAQGMSARES